MIAAILLILSSQPVYAEQLTFSDAAKALFGQSEVWRNQEFEIGRLKLDYDIGIGQFYDPTIRFDFENQYRGDYLNRRSDVSLIQRTPIWGTALSAGYRRGAGDFAIYDAKNVTQDGGELRFGLEVPLLRGGWIDPSRLIAEKGAIFNADFESILKANEIETLRNLGNRYWDWFVNEHRFKIAQELLRVAKDRQVQVVRRADKGDIAQIEAVEGERTILQREAAVAAAARASNRARLDLSWLLGIELNEGIDPPEEELKIDESEIPEKVEKSSLELNPEVVRQKVQLRQAAVDREFAENQFFPKLDFKMNWSQDLGTNKTKYSLVQSDFGLYLEWQIPSRANAARRSQARITESRQELQLTLTERRIENAINDSTVFLKTSALRSKAAVSEIQVSKRLVDAEQKRFFNGDSTLLLVNIREQNWLDSRQRRVEAVADFYKARLEYDLANAKVDQAKR
jgi:cobalt-zinc-cadmium efflux system outer membrane protein